ncbi:dihydrolipoyl dehydrogenase [Desulfospira joergensenii]|uniref:dihydrolipoyl dehydrogenase n=1 Tax=Desulfospira joergensenii TaxID=53329 RepID=UPI0003B78806|nr:dihydrolipoyl dehydrogenase [Desulfospira joergensenii]
MVVGELTYDTDLVVLGGGPGGYTAAIRAADLGKEVMLVEARPGLGGVCLTEGCIPSKTLIHAVGLKENLKDAQSMGVIHDPVRFDPERLGQWIGEAVKDLSQGISSLFKNRHIQVVQGHGRFIENHKLFVQGTNTSIRFRQAVIATGSRINTLPESLLSEKDLDLWTSAQALTLPEIPESLLVIGGGYIGLEIGQAYAGLGSEVTLVEFNPRLLSGADPDLVKVVLHQCEKDFKDIHTGSKITRIVGKGPGFEVEFEKDGKTISQIFDRVLAATGRRPNTDDIGLDLIGLNRDDKGLIHTDDQCRTSLGHIFAVGDITPGPALAHKAAREGKVAAEVIAGQSSAFDNVAVPAVLFTRPELAWTGLTESRAKEKKIPFTLGRFPLTALGRAKSTGKTQGFVKILADPESSLILGMGMAGEHASELIGQGTLAIEMGATLEDLMVSIQPHPTFSEALMEAAEAAATGSVHLGQRRR